MPEGITFPPPEKFPAESETEAPLQIAAGAWSAIVAFGCTVTSITCDGPTHDPAIDVGMTMYCTGPAELPGLFNVCVIEDPDPLDSPVMPPVTVPIVQVKLLGVLAVSAMLVAVPVQI